jgi:hypothetical protein
MDISDYSEPVLRYFQLHPYLTVYLIEPITFTLGISMALCAGWLINCPCRPLNVTYWAKVMCSVLILAGFAFLCLNGMICGCVVAKGQDASAASMFTFIPLGIAILICRTIGRFIIDRRKHIFKEDLQFGLF